MSVAWETHNLKKILQMCLICCMSAAVFCGCDSIGTQIKWDDRELETESESDTEEVLFSEHLRGQDQTEAVRQLDNVQEDLPLVYVDVCGAVKVPGVYEIKAGSRIFEVIALAGGLAENADLTRINQAQPVEDGMKIRIFTVDEITESNIEAMPDQSLESSSENGYLPDQTKVNLNTAELSQLMTLPGIGESRARDILAYRSQHGSFQTIEEIMNINGIKSAVFDKIKDKIVVG